MGNTVVIGKKRTLRDCGYNEKWLEEQLAKDPSVLPLGRRMGEGLRRVYQQRGQISGGKLDLLLEDTESDEGAIYEVELMLGDTDPSHIIRTIEYWDNERRKWPQRPHTAVLVAESITNRFFNVIRLLGDAIPFIAIQMDVIEADGQWVLHFSKVLDTYVEPDPETGGEPADEAYWKQNAPETLTVAKKLQAILVEAKCGASSLHITQNYISLMVDSHDWVWLHRRAKGKSRVNFWLAEPFLSKAITCLDEAGIEWKKRDNYHGGTAVYFTMGPEMIDGKVSCLATLCQLGHQSIKAEPLL